MYNYRFSQSAKFEDYEKLVNDHLIILINYLYPVTFLFDRSQVYVTCTTLVNKERCELKQKEPNYGIPFHSNFERKNKTLSVLFEATVNHWMTQGLKAWKPKDQARHGQYFNPTLYLNEKLKKYTCLVKSDIT